MFDFLEEILHQFKDVPGLQFLKRIYNRFLVARSSYARRRDRVRSLQASVKAAATSAGRLGQKAREKKRRKEQ